MLLCCWCGGRVRIGPPILCRLVGLQALEWERNREQSADQDRASEPTDQGMPKSTEVLIEHFPHSPPVQEPGMMLMHASCGVMDTAQPKGQI